MSECVLTLLAPTGMGEALSDWLLEYHEELVFISQPVSCHGMPQEALGTAEQVTGRQQRLLIQVQVSVDTAKDIRRLLAGVFEQAPIRYWMTPVLEAGFLGE